MTDRAEDSRLRLAFAGLHPERARTLVDRYGVAGVVKRLLAGAVEASPRVRAAVEVPAKERMSELGAVGTRPVFLGDGDYPGGLGELPDAPDVLFVRGRVPSVPTVAIVGTRRCTTYGRHLAFEYGLAVADAGWCVVSGLARGIDGAAHKGVTSAGGLGVGVLGCGIDVAYPPEHADLAEALVADGGGLVTEYPPGSPPESWRFPPRNRIISGLASVLVVVEAAVTGGALITAGFAITQGKLVFAVPGDVRRASSEGCNRLIRDGAHPVLDPDDLIEELSLVLGSPSTKDRVAS